jgi:hypothetical protein
VRHPTVKTYELIAHLLKHRFLDAVINMNFDELLDQSLDDELGVGEYQRIVSDRDCVAVQTDEQETDYVPLYIKLHGTASEPESLRFTRESYYDSPARVGTVAAELFQVPECVIVNVGFGLGSFDLHRLLAIPDTLRLFNLSKTRLQKSAMRAITREREASMSQKKEARSLQGTTMGKKGEKRRRKKTRTHFCERDRGSLKRSCDYLLSGLLERIEGHGQRVLEDAPAVISLRSVKRHDAVVCLLGPKSKMGRRLIKLPRSLEEARFSLDPQARAAKPDAVYGGYLWRRAVLELTLAMARGRGLVSVKSLAVDRGGHYYDAYRRHVGENAATWKDLYTLVGFKQNEEVPDVFEATEEIRSSNGPTPEKLAHERLLEVPEGQRDEWSELPQLDASRLVERVLPHIVDSPTDSDWRGLMSAVERVRAGSEHELHSRDDRVCAKTFSNPVTLKTISSLDAYSFELVRQASLGDASEVDIIAETGHWLRRRRDDVIVELAAQGRIRLIVAFLCEVEDLLTDFPGIRLSHQQPWHHNRHMVILKDKGEPRAAIYFARHQRTPYVTPVYVRTRADIGVLQTTFEDRWEYATGIGGTRDASDRR